MWNFIKKYWQFALGFLFIVLAVYFFEKSRTELGAIKRGLTKADPIYLLIGTLISCMYVLFQGMIYYFSFRAVNGQVSLYKSIILFLKRFAVSVVLPAGGAAALALFISDVENERTPRTKIYLGSILFGFVGIFSVFLFILPGLLAMEVHKTINKEGMLVILILFIFILLAGIIFYSLYKQTWAFRIITKKIPDFTLVAKEMSSGNFRKREFAKAAVSSLLLDSTGVLHLYLSMHAVTGHAHWQQAFVGHIASASVMIISPFLKGTGAVEGSLSFILTRFHVPVETAIPVSLIYRFFQFWIPVLLGALTLLLFSAKKVKEVSIDKIN